MKFSKPKKNKLEKKLTILPAYECRSDAETMMDPETTMDEEMEIVLNSVYGRSSGKVTSFTRTTNTRTSTATKTTTSLNSIPTDTNKTVRSNGSNGCRVRCLKITISLMIGIIILMFGFLVRKNAKDSMTPIPTTSTSTSTSQSQFFDEEQQDENPAATAQQQDEDEEETKEDEKEDEDEEQPNNEILGTIEFVIKDLRHNASMFPLAVCKGDCDNDSECGEGLGCRQRDAITDPVSIHCIGEPDSPTTDYCVPIEELKQKPEEEPKEEEEPEEEPEEDEEEPEEEEEEPEEEEDTTTTTTTSSGNSTTTTSTTPLPPNVPRFDYFQGCLPDRFDNEGMDLSVDPRYNFNQLRPGQFICSKPYRFKASEPNKIPQRYQFGMTNDGTKVVWRDIFENTTIVVMESPTTTTSSGTDSTTEDGAGNVVPYFSLRTDGTMVLHNSHPNQKVTLEPQNLQHPMSEEPTRCLSNHDCPYFHIHSGGVLVLNYIASDGDGWQAKNFLKAYGL